MDRTDPLVTLSVLTGRRRQLSFTAAIEFAVPAQPDFQRLDAWLVEVLHLNMAGAGVFAGLTQTVSNESALSWLHRALLLGRYLLQAGRIPVFDDPSILGCESVSGDGQRWRAEVSFPRIEELSTAAYNIALKAALHLNAWAFSREASFDNLQAFYAFMEKEVVPRLQPHWKAGKSTIPVLRAAHQLSIPFTHLGAGVFQLGWGSKALRIDRSVTGRDSAIGSKMANDKALSAVLLRKAGLPAPSHRVVTDLKAALDAAHRMGWPVVVKPADRERGEGVVVDVGSDEQLKSAFVAALKLSRARKVIIERQVEGVCHRLFMVNGRLLYAVKRLPMSVEGDGIGDVAGLIEAEVARQMRLAPWDRTGIKPLDDLARAELNRTGYTPQSVPAKGERVALRRIESTEWGGVDEDVTQRIHPENLRVANAATELFGLAVAGIDIITPDISRPWFENGAIVNEVNYAPLLGGGEISRSHLTAFLGRLIDGKGTIPVEVFVGAEAAWAAAEHRWMTLVRSGQQACLSDDRRTLRASGELWRMAAAGLYGRTRAMVLSPSVQALVLVVRTDEFLVTGLPLESVDSITVVDRRIASVRAGGAVLEQEPVDLFLRVLEGWRRDHEAR